MGVGYLGLADRIDHTTSSEWSTRGVPITTEQIHHTAYPSDEGSRRLMDAGGRTVSANYLLLRDGTLVEVVPGQYRAFTSASAADRYSLTIETVNQTGGPTWGISEAQRKRLAKLNVDMAAAGIGIRVGGRGTGAIIGHSEVPGSYATACPGPDMHLDHIAALAASGNIGAEAPRPKETDMPLAYLQNQTRDHRSVEYVAVVGGGVKGGMLQYPPTDRGGFNEFKIVYDAAAKAAGLPELPVVSIDYIAYERLEKSYVAEPSSVDVDLSDEDVAALAEELKGSLPTTITLSGELS